MYKVECRDGVMVQRRAGYGGHMFSSYVECLCWMDCGAVGRESPLECMDVDGRIALGVGWRPKRRWSRMFCNSVCRRFEAIRIGCERVEREVEYKRLHRLSVGRRAFGSVLLWRKYVGGCFCWSNESVCYRCLYYVMQFGSLDEEMMMRCAKLMDEYLEYDRMYPCESYVAEFRDLLGALREFSRFCEVFF